MEYWIAGTAVVVLVAFVAYRLNKSKGGGKFSGGGTRRKEEK